MRGDATTERDFSLEAKFNIETGGWRKKGTPNHPPTHPTNQSIQIPRCIIQPINQRTEKITDNNTSRHIYNSKPKNNTERAGWGDLGHDFIVRQASMPKQHVATPKDARVGVFLHQPALHVRRGHNRRLKQQKNNRQTKQGVHKKEQRGDG